MQTEAVIVYDGECPFCSRYVQVLRLRESVGAVRLINAREGGPEVEDALHRGFNLDEGMLLRLNGQYFHGDDCIHRLALLSTPNGAFNRLNALVFRSKRLSRLLYPVLRSGRNTLLALLGRERLSPK